MTKLTKAQKTKALDELKMLKGLPPHNTFSNICYGDGYFAASLIRKYGMSLSELEEAVGIRKKEKKYLKAKQKLEKRHFG